MRLSGSRAHKTKQGPPASLGFFTLTMGTAPKVWASLLTFSLVAIAGCGASQSAQPPTANLACRLPVGSYPAGAGGFIDLPSGAFVRDLQSAFSYDAASGRWLPVPRAMISPDGMTYVDAEPNYVKPYGTTLVRLVDLASQKERATWTVEGNAAALGWTSGGIYFVRSASKDPSFEGPELWALDPTTGQQRLVAPQPKPGVGLPLFKAWTALGGTAVWSKTVPDTPPSNDILERVDLATGHAVRWLTATGLTVLGWDEQGHPFVALGDDRSVRLVRMLGPNETVSISSNGFSAPGDMSPSEVTDSHGSWFVGAHGSIWFLPTGDQMQLTRLAAVPLPTPTPPQSDVGFQPTLLFVAGPCV